MRKKIACVLFVLIGLNSSITSAQIKFIKGHILTNEGKEISCFIKDKEWVNSPDVYAYKLTKEGKVLSINAEDITELKISNRVYVRKFVNIDVPENDSYHIKSSRVTKNISKSLLLKQVITGDIELFEYNKSGYIKFFYRKKNGPIIQLKHSKYIDIDQKIKEEKPYQKQLWDAFKCSGDKVSSFVKIEYTKKDLKTLFVKYANCKKLDIKVHKQQKINFKELIHVSPKIGFSYSSAEAYPQILSSEFKTKSDILSLSYGGEIELFFPLLNKKLSFVGSFSNYNASKTIDYTNTGGRPYLNGDVNIDYQITNSSLGLRYYFYIDEDSQFFSSVFFAQDAIDGSFDYNSSEYNVQYANTTIDGNDVYTTFGVGYKYKRAFVELLYSNISKSNLKNTAPVVAIDLPLWNLNRNVISINIGYNIF